MLFHRIVRAHIVTEQAEAEGHAFKQRQNGPLPRHIIDEKNPAYASFSAFYRNRQQILNPFRLFFLPDGMELLRIICRKFLVSLLKVFQKTADILPLLRKLPMNAFVFPFSPHKRILILRITGHPKTDPFCGCKKPYPF